MMMIGFTQHRVRAKGLELRGAKNLKTANRSGFSKKKKITLQYPYYMDIY
jgi:hypothetical protein